MRLPRAKKARANFPWANLLRSLEVHPLRDRSSLPFLFHAEENHKSGQHERFRDRSRSYSCTLARCRGRRQPVIHTLLPRHPTISLSLGLCCACDVGLARPLLHRCYLAHLPLPPRSSMLSLSPSPLPSISKDSAPHLLRCSSFSIR